MTASAAARGRVIGSYVLYDEIASGGMATVHVGRLLGPSGFSRTVAIKNLHAQYAKDPAFVAMFLDEARIASRIRHPNVVSTLDVVSLGKEVFLVMDYIHGETLAALMGAAAKRAERIPPSIVASIVVNVLDGLHAAHEATDERGKRLSIVHRDVSPPNVIVGSDGAARVLDFGVAKAAARSQTTRDGSVKGKLAYMAPEQITRQPLDGRTDVFAASILLWELLTGQSLFAAEEPAAVVARVMNDVVAPPSRATGGAGGISPALDALVLKGLERSREMRFAAAEEMARVLEATVPPAPAAEVAAWVTRIAGGELARRAERIVAIESDSPRRDTSPPVVSPESGTVPLRREERVSRPPPPRRTAPPAAMATAGTMKVKAQGLLNAAKFIEEHFGREALQEVLGACSPAVRETYTSATVINWHPAEELCELVEVAESKLSIAHRRLIEEIGAAGARANMQGVVLRMAFYWGKPEFLIKRAASMWRQFNDEGEMELLMFDDRRARVEVRGIKQPRESFCRLLTGWCTEVSTALGAQNATVQHVRCRTRGDANCFWDVRHVYEAQ